MKPVPILAVAAALSLLVGCTTDRIPYSAMHNARYSAIGENPFWMVAIDRTKVVLTVGAGTDNRPGALSRHAFDGAVRQDIGDSTRWEAGRGTGVVAVEARPGPCTAGGRDYEDRVVVTLSGRMMEGCGGRQISGRRDR